ncbi:hypothetical protein, conserved [Eimeria brunetti]|uniref:Kelch motif domain-containing protein n=1 Tax=Eimeria brunetti TaxID=51314 RepID=U6LIE8_9EIME|nr:hypothetical protein, conserved [Eimeria brunetti]
MVVGASSSEEDLQEGPSAASFASEDDEVGMEASVSAGEGEPAAAAPRSKGYTGSDHLQRAATHTQTVYLHSSTQGNAVTQLRPAPLQLHFPRPRVGHTISPFNLPTRAPQQLQKQQEQTPVYSREQQEQQRQQQLQATARPLPSQQGSSSGDSNNGSSSRCNDSSRKASNSVSSNSSGNNENVELRWARLLVRPVMVGGCCAAAAGAAAAAAPNEVLHKVIERTSEIVGDAFLGFTAAEAAASLRQIPLPLLQDAAAAAAARAQKLHPFLPGTASSPPPAAAARQQRLAVSTMAVLERDWVERYISRLCAAGSSCWLWWRLQIAEVPRGPGSAAAAAAAASVTTPERRVHHAAASVSAEKQCSAVAVFGGRTASGDLADNELYLLEVTQLLGLDLPLYILGDLLSLALSERAREGAAAAAASAAAAEEVGAAPPAAAPTSAGTPMAAACATGTALPAAGDICSNSSGCASSSVPPVLRWRVPFCVGQKPSPRLGHSLVYAEPHLILYGGKDERGRLLNDVWLLDIFDWRKVARPTAAGEESAAVAAFGGVGSAPAAGEAPAAGAAARETALCWVTLDFSSSPLKPPGRFLHSCSVFFTSTNDGSCSIVIGGGWTSVVFPRSRLYALHRNSKGRWRHVGLAATAGAGAGEAALTIAQGMLPVRVTNAADGRFMHASVCAGSSLLLSGGLQIRLGAPPQLLLPSFCLYRRCICVLLLAVELMVYVCYDLLPTSSVGPLLATRYQMQAELQRRAGAVAAARTQQLPLQGSDDAAAVEDTHDFGGAGGSGNSSSIEQVSMEQQDRAANVLQRSSSNAMVHQQTTRRGSAPRDTTAEVSVATETRWTSAAAAAEGISMATQSPRERAPADTFSSCGRSKRPCSRPWTFDSSSFSKRGSTAEGTAGAAPVAAGPAGVTAAAANAILGACATTSFKQVQGRAEGGEGLGEDAAAMAVIHQSSGDPAAHSLAAAAVASVVSSEMCQLPDVTVCTPRRSRRMAALQALESFKLLPDTLGAATADAPVPELQAPTPAAAVAVAMPSAAKGI